MNGVQLFLLVLALVVVAAVVAAVWIRRRRSGHVLMTDRTVAPRSSGGGS